MHCIIGTRGSKLAVAQAEYVREKLQDAWPEDEFSIRTISTKGDCILDKPLQEIGGKGIFVHEIEQALLSGEIHIAVHSMKDMPVVPERGLMFAPCMKREDSRDVLILRTAASLEELSKGAVIGTGSIRRKAQLLRMRPDLKIVGIRGNVDTRIHKLFSEKLDGIVLAAAGLHRLGLKEKITQYLSYEQMLPSPAQGVLGLEICEGSEEIKRFLSPLWDEESDRTAGAEREFLRLCGGDCHMPVAAVCERIEGGYRLRAMTGDADGSCLSFADVQGECVGELAGIAMRQILSTQQLHPQLTLKDRKKGMVYLVGAGPGDPSLITVRGLEVLKQADCVIYDRLVSTDLLSCTSVECECICVGKSSRSHIMEQDEIQKLLIRKAEQYSCVVRLKGGDPFIFGRGGEEALALKSAGIPCCIVPGVTSAAAAPACAGIPVTHRGIAGGFRVVTAHGREDRLTSIDFASMAKGKETCIFLMGLSHLEEIVNGLLQAGMSPETKAAVISMASMREQRICEGTLSNLAMRAGREDLKSPAVIVVGDVVGLRKDLPVWEGASSFPPLAEKRGRILLPITGSGENPLEQMLEQRGFFVENIPVGEIVYEKHVYTKEEITRPDWLVFTSRHGVWGFIKQLMASGLDLRDLSGVQIACVGGKTSDVLRESGLRADFMPSSANAATLFSELSAELCDGSLVWYIKGREASYTGAEADALSKNIHWESKTVYTNREIPGERICADDYDTAVFTCASAASRLMKRIPFIPDKWQKDGVYSMGPSCTARLRQLGFETVCQVDTPGYENLCERICRDLDGQ